MALSILYMANKCLAHLGIHIFLNIAQNCFDDGHIGAFVMPSHIVNLTQATLLNNHVNCLAVILYIEPVSNLHTVAVNRQLFVLQGVVDHQRNQLFRELVWAVIVRTPGDIDGKPVCIPIGLHKEVSRTLAGRVGAVGV